MKYVYNIVMEKNYEEYLVYRLIKTLYILALIFVVVCSLLMGWEARQKQVTDLDKSSIICDNNKVYSIQTAGFFYYDGLTSLSTSDEKEARKLCAYGVLNDYSDKYENLITPANRNYKLNTILKSEGSWLTTIAWVVLGSLLGYIVLSLMRETVNYVLLGKRFDWLWLISLLYWLDVMFNDSKNEEKLKPRE